MTRRPNLFVVGAAKCATSSLHTYLSLHPQIYMSSLKEPGYFAEPESRTTKLRPFSASGTTTMKPYRNDMESYLRLFEDAGGADYIGESSTAYSQRPHREGVAERIHSFNSDARIVYVMRDPVERAISHYWWNVQNEDEQADLETAIRQNPVYCDLSHYSMQLTPYLQLFGRDRVFWLTLESLRTDPDDLVRDVFRWLGVDTSIPLQGIQKRENETPDVVAQPRFGFLNRIRFSGGWSKVGRWIPKQIRSAASRFNARSVDRSAVDTTSTVEYLRSVQCEQVAELRELLDYEFGEWTNFNTVSFCKT
jgi:Sulfotransferase domain